jgi:hypothetical protein
MVDISAYSGLAPNDCRSRRPTSGARSDRPAITLVDISNTGDFFQGRSRSAYCCSEWRWCGSGGLQDLRAHLVQCCLDSRIGGLRRCNTDQHHVRMTPRRWPQVRRRRNAARNCSRFRLHRRLPAGHTLPGGGKRHRLPGSMLQPNVRPAPMECHPLHSGAASGPCHDAVMAGSHCESLAAKRAGIM